MQSKSKSMPFSSAEGGVVSGVEGVGRAVVERATPGGEVGGSLGAKHPTILCLIRLFWRERAGYST